MTMVWNRINTFILFSILFALLAVIAMLATDARGGPLDPPGSPGATDGVLRPGTPISGPTTISQPGYYYLTRNISVAGSQTAIVIDAENVTLDLAGFTISGGLLPGGAGILVNERYAEILNGTIAKFYINIDDATPVGRAYIHDIVLADSASRAVEVSGNSVLRDCVVVNSNGEGVVIKGDNSSVTGCAVLGNQLNGIFVIGNFNIIERNSLAVNGHAFPPNDIAGIRLFGYRNVVRGNTLNEPWIPALYNTGTGSSIIENAGLCYNGIIKGDPIDTAYAANICLPVVP